MRGKVIVHFSSDPIAEAAARRFRYRVRRADENFDTLLLHVDDVQKRGKDVIVVVRYEPDDDIRFAIARRLMLAAGVVGRVSYETCDPAS